MIITASTLLLQKKLFQGVVGMFIGILGALLFLSGLAVLLITFVQKIMKKPQLLPKKISLSMVAIGIVLFFVGVAGSGREDVKSDSSSEASSQSEKIESQVAVESGSESSSQPEKLESQVAVESEAESTEPEVMTAADWVKIHENENIDTIIADYNSLVDEAIKSEVDEQIANKNTTMFGKTVVVTGTAIEFYEGYDGFDKGSFIVLTDAGNRVRVAARTPNEALDIGERVEVKGLLAMWLSHSEEYYVREASMSIK